MMIVNQLFNQLQEAGLPFLLQKYRKTFKCKDIASFPPRIQNILEQWEMWAYEVSFFSLGCMYSLLHAI